MTQMGDFESERVVLENEKTQLHQKIGEQRSKARETRDNAHQLALAVQSKRTAKQSLIAAVERISSQLAQLGSKRDSLRAQIAAQIAPLADMEAELKLHLEQKSLVEKKLSDARRRLEESNALLQRLDTERQRAEFQITQMKDVRGKSQLEHQAIAIKADSLNEQITASGLERDALLAALSDDADPKVWASTLDELEQKIRRLEPVNLAAIKELDEHSTRKQYLDAQNQDLTDALTTLEQAIGKIDGETKARFKETFDKVNSGMQELFPRLFGGGHAALELTGEDLLTTGVTIIARPPGKRPTNIGLLSGGEKALTAVALVFAIFRLNPAPFCLLDEVDAPLDEANVGRFSEMVKEMSDKVQFLCVTHNKVTMEASQQLAGVTMREAGVSRLVSVDLAEATRLTAQAA
jgi:chromosome segregation protein